ncbi:MAG: DUF6065 family protein [Asticcacaulis sp.]|uniref:DUF6065 family protein n=1 Tax=Asticcacaulis sp. TaxID=1872648 RepID=UPI003F7B6217
MELECFVMTTYPPEIVPGRPERDWMESFQSRFPYRCLPLTMANTTGWEILCPVDFTIMWNGGKGKDDIIIGCDSDPNYNLEHLVTSHFTHGVVTFHTGYMFRTPPGYAVQASGAPNFVKDGIAPLTGLVETDWLPFPFTMNWLMTRPGAVSFKKGEPFCFIQVVEHKKQDDIQPVIKALETDPDLKGQFQAWAKMRSEFNDSLSRRDPEAVKEQWQKFYFRGEKPAPTGDVEKIGDHVNKRRLKTPKVIRPKSSR